jgi:hypothetical protein
MNLRRSSSNREPPWFTGPPPATENDIEKACLDLLAIRQYFVVRIHCGTFRSADCKRWLKGADKGTPDYIAAHALYPAFLLETKRPGAALGPDQVFRVREIQVGYRIAFVKADSARELRVWLDQHEQAHGASTTSVAGALKTGGSRS